MVMLEKGSEKNMIRRISLKIKKHNEDDAYETFPMEIEEDVFASFIMYDDEGLFPHCHIRIWKKDGEDRKELYHVAIRLDKAKFFHIKELGVLDNKRYLKKIINLLETKIDDDSSFESLRRFLLCSWNLTSWNHKVNSKKIKIPEYRKMLR